MSLEATPLPTPARLGFTCHDSPFYLRSSTHPPAIFPPSPTICCIINSMARGWESKSVEEQIDAAEVGSSSPDGERLTQAQIELIWKKEGLVRSRSRVQRDLENSHNPRYREILSAALADLDEQISKLD